MRYDIIGWTLAAIHWWKHKDEKPWDPNDQPEPIITVKPKIDLQCTRGPDTDEQIR